MPNRFNRLLNKFINAKVLSIQEETLVHRLLGNLVLNLWDCGGQEAFMENYFASQRDNIFRNVEVKSLNSRLQDIKCADIFDKKKASAGIYLLKGFKLVQMCIN